MVRCQCGIMMCGVFFVCDQYCRRYHNTQFCRVMSFDWTREANGYFRNKYFPLPPNSTSNIRRRGVRKTPKGEMTAFFHLHSRSLQHLCRCLFYFCSHRGLRLMMAWCFNYIFVFLVWSINRLDWSRVER